MRRLDAAQQLVLTERKTQRLMNRFRDSGAAGLVNLRRGRPDNHRLPESLKQRVISLLHDHYSDYGPTLAAEKLRERHNITVFVETLRKWMIADGLWVPYSRCRPAFINPDTGVTASDTLFRLMVLHMTGLKVERRNAACSSLLMTRLVA